MRWGFFIIALLIGLAFVNPESSIVYGSTVEQPMESEVSDLAQQFNLTNREELAIKESQDAERPWKFVIPTSQIALDLQDATQGKEQEDILQFDMQDTISPASAPASAQQLNLTESELKDLVSDLASDLSEEISRVECTVYPEFDLQLCLPNFWVLTKELYNNMNLSGSNNINSTLTLEVVPCFEWSPSGSGSVNTPDGGEAAAVVNRGPGRCENLRGDDLIRPYSPPEQSRIRPPDTWPVMTLQYNVSGLRNESGIRDIDLLTDYTSKIISEISKDNRTIINQIAPAEIDEKKAVRISYDTPTKVGESLVCCDHVTRIIVVGNNRIYEISYSVDNLNQFSDIPAVEEIIENTKLTGPFTPGQLVPRSSPL